MSMKKERYEDLNLGEEYCQNLKIRQVLCSDVAVYIESQGIELLNNFSAATMEFFITSDCATTIIVMLRLKYICEVLFGRDISTHVQAILENVYTYVFGNSALKYSYCLLFDQSLVQ